jgi:hypothetical protein
MRPETVQREVTSTGVLSTSRYKFAPGSEAHLFNLLRNSLYSDKPLALLREYWTNGRDAHFDAFVGDLPVDVALPTDIEPTLVIRDYGFGMSEWAIHNTFAAYGASTKRDSNESVGFMGIGSKSAHSYVDVFTVTSYYMGERTVYNCVIDASGIGDVNKVWVEPCGSETGIEIRIPVLPKDIPAFVRAATFLFTYATPPPNINIPITRKAVDKHAHGFVVRRNADDVVPGKWLAVMGSVPYNLDFSRMLDEMVEAGLEEAVANTEGGLYFDIGEVSVSASREELEYTTRTKEAVVARLRLLLDELVGVIDRTISDQLMLPWAKRLATREFQETTKLRVSARYASWQEERVALYSREVLKDGDGNPVQDARGNYVLDGPRTFRLHGYGCVKDFYGRSDTLSSKLEEEPTVPVHADTRILVKDTALPVKSFILTKYDRVAVPTGSAKVEAVQAELTSLLAAANLSGVKVVLLSSLRPERVESASPKKQGNLKHWVRRFVLRDYVHTTPAFSRNWDIVDHEPGPDDVFVILDHFEVVPSRGRNFYETVAQDRHIVRYLGGEFPPVYGVKTTAKHPVDVKAVLGTPYAEWRHRTVKALVAQNTTLRGEIEDFRWHRVLSDGWNFRNTWEVRDMVTKWTTLMGADHPITTLLRRHYEAREAHAKKSQDERDVLIELWRADASPDEADAALKALRTRYPLLNPSVTNADFSVVLDENRRSVWLDYVRLIDEASP